MSKVTDKMDQEVKTTGLRVSTKSQLENIKKVAVTKQGQQALFLELDQNRPLAGVIQDICEKWGLLTPEDYALQFSEPNGKAYITERNRKDILNGNVLELTSSPAKTAKLIYDKMKEGKSDEKLEALKKLSSIASDNTFALEFITKEGHNLVKHFVMDGKMHGEPLSYTLKSFVFLMDHNVVSWDTIEPEFTKKVCDCVLSQKTGISCLLPSLEILESVVLNSNQIHKHTAIEQHITPEKISVHLQSSDLQKSAMALLNALFLKATPEKRKKISDSVQSKGFRNIIITSVLSSRSMGSEMAHQLHSLQTLMLNMHATKMNTPADPNDPNVQKQIESLRKAAFDSDNDLNQPGNRKSNLYKKLGFQNQSNPAQDFAEHTPPGVLALENIHYFANKHQENYVKVVLENTSRADEHDCPYVQASIMLIKTLCEILRIGEPPLEDSQVYHPMLFSHEKPFEELFCICIQLLNKTWREMRASTEDFPKVLGVVKEQITRALDLRTTSFETFKQKLNQLDYTEIIKLWESERKQIEEWESQAKPIVELRGMIEPKVIELIKQHRLNYLMEGTKFTKIAIKGRVKEKQFWYWKLTPNQKAFLYGDCGDNENPHPDQLTNKLQVSEIKYLLIGKDCPHVKEKAKSKSTLFNTAFAIQPNTAEEGAESFCFVAKDNKEFDMWTDGINALMGNEMASHQMDRDKEMLLNMEIRIQLLDAEGITIPTEPPSLPPEPDNYDFVYPDI